MPIIKLIYGDKESPTDTLDLNDGSLLRVRGDSGSLAGEESTLLFDVMGGSQAELGQVVADLERWATRARRWSFADQREDQRTWLQYSWADIDIAAPFFGQWYKYLPIHDIAIVMPADIHSGNLPGDNPLIERLALTLRHGPQAEGLERKLLDVTSSATAQVDIAMTTELTDDFTIMGWIKTAAENASLFCYGSGGSEFELSSATTRRLGMTWDGWTLWDSLSGAQFTGVTDYYGSTLANGWHHFALTYERVAIQDDDTVSLYIDGELAMEYKDAGGETVPQPGSGEDFILNDDTTLDVADYAGWRMWAGTVLSATEIAAIYEQEAALAAADREPLPRVITDGGDGSLDNVNGTLSSSDKDNWLLCRGIPGGAPALARYEITLPASVTDKGLWLGRLASEEALSSTAAWWVDLSGTSDTGNSSGDAYEGDTTSGAGTDSSDFDGALTDPQRGRFTMLARLKVDGADAAAVGRLEYNGVVYAETNEISTTDSASFLLQNVGDLFIDWPASGPPASATVAVVVSEQEGTALTNGCDFICLLPWPYTYVYTADSVSTSANDVLHIREHATWLESSAGAWAGWWQVRGGPVTLAPGLYNYLVFLLGEAGAAYTVGRTFDVAVYCTPRWAVAS
jgi:hypothetical protein